METSYDVFTLYDQYSVEQKQKLFELYELISSASEKELVQSLKWNQLSFASKQGTPVRIDRFSEDEVALFVPCQTTLVEEWRELFRDKLKFSGNRAIVFSVDEELPVDALKSCLQMAFNYHRGKR